LPFDKIENRAARTISPVFLFSDDFKFVIDADRHSSNDRTGLKRS
jgi:hypothetical protein